MSYSTFKKVMLLSVNCCGYSVGKAISKDIIKKAEKITNITFSKILTEYLETYGYLELFGCEIFGIVKENFNDLSNIEGCIIEYALYERKNAHLPEKWLPIYNYDDGYMAFLDFNNLNAEGEPYVITAFFNGNEYVKIEQTTEDFGDFLLRLVLEQLKNN